MTDDIPSPFYDQFDGAARFKLSFPVDDDGVGPDWDALGVLDTSRSPVRAKEEVELVDLGGGRYRLAEKCDGPFSGLRLQWGDEFIAEISAGGGLVMSLVIEPRKYRHFQFMVSHGFSNDHPIAGLIHRLMGGWEIIAGGMLTVTLPVATAFEFEQKLIVGNLAKGWVRNLE